MTSPIAEITSSQARRIWLNAQRLDRKEPFGKGAEATPAAISHLGYVQIDTINVIERCHHHILWSRIPDYRREHLHQAQSIDKNIFEYWTHALSYVPLSDLRFFLPEMKRLRQFPDPWYSSVTKAELRRVLTLIRDGGALSIRDIADDILVEKDHPWGSRKPSKLTLQLAFYTGALTVSARAGMVKTYELPERHFAWQQKPKPASEQQVTAYLLDRALRSQGVVSLDSICHLDARRKSAIRRLIDARVRRKQLAAIAIEGDKIEHWTEPHLLDSQPALLEETVHILSPFDPLIIQRKRLKRLFGYEHRFEAYVPKEKRIFGYFALPVLIGDEIVAAIDLKTDRVNQQLLIQQWSWVGKFSPAHKPKIEAALHLFERFQLQKSNPIA